MEKTENNKTKRQSLLLAMPLGRRLPLAVGVVADLKGHMPIHVQNGKKELPPPPLPKPRNHMFGSGPWLVPEKKKMFRLAIILDGI